MSKFVLYTEIGNFAFLDYILTFYLQVVCASLNILIKYCEERVRLIIHCQL